MQNAWKSMHLSPLKHFSQKTISIKTWQLGSVWIEFILLKLKIENWKHCTKIIFKCVNNVVGPIFNEKVTEVEFVGP